MTMHTAAERSTELYRLCESVRNYIHTRNYQKCVSLICEAMGKFPHAPQPHNLMGIVLEQEGDHAEAMKHFRAAWALDPTYLPARQNLDHYGTFFSQGACAFDEDDCPDAAAARSLFRED